MTRWSEQEEHTIRQYYTVMSDANLTKLIPYRSVYAITRRRRGMGLKRRRVRKKKVLPFSMQLSWPVLLLTDLEFMEKQLHQRQVPYIIAAENGTGYSLYRQPIRRCRTKEPHRSSWVKTYHHPEMGDWGPEDV